MTAPFIKQLPIKIRADNKSDVRTQFAALCYRIEKGKAEVLLITSRRTGRWIVPKGWPMNGKTPAECAAQEAWEEAGVVGQPLDRCLGLYSYRKFVAQKTDIPCIAMIFPVKVKSLDAKYPEAAQRKRQWFTLRKAASLVTEPELASILRDFDPKLLR